MKVEVRDERERERVEKVGSVERKGVEGRGRESEKWIEREERCKERG